MRRVRARGGAVGHRGRSPDEADREEAARRPRQPQQGCSAHWEGARGGPSIGEQTLRQGCTARGGQREGRQKKTRGKKREKTEGQDRETRRTEGQDGVRHKSPSTEGARECMSSEALEGSEMLSYA